MSETRCLLCFNDQLSLRLVKSDGRRYWDCYACGLLFLDEEFHLTPSKEKTHYLGLDTDLSDARYQAFVSPVIDYVTKNFSANSRGLDYGAGPGPVISALLKRLGYEMHLYDPYFWDDHWSLTKLYDFIVACEVVAHFHSPADEFHKLKYLLRPGGELAIVTDVYEDSIDFEAWSSHEDPTHVVFYRMRTFDWIRHHYGFRELVRAPGRSVVLRS